MSPYKSISVSLGLAVQTYLNGVNLVADLCLFSFLTAFMSHDCVKTADVDNIMIAFFNKHS